MTTDAERVQADVAQAQRVHLQAEARLLEAVASLHATEDEFTASWRTLNAPDLYRARERIASARERARAASNELAVAAATVASVQSLAHARSPSFRVNNDGQDGTWGDRLRSVRTKRPSLAYARASGWMRTAEVFVSPRIAREELGDVLENLRRFEREGRPRWHLYVHATVGIVLALWHTWGDKVSALVKRSG